MRNLLTVAIALSMWALAVTSGPALATNGEGSEADKIRALIHGYVEHRKSLDNFRCVYRVYERSTD